MMLWKRILIGFVLKIFLMKVVYQSVIIKDPQKTHLDRIHFFVEKTSTVDLNVSFDIT
jgi:hypothetical protein